MPSRDITSGTFTAAVFWVSLLFIDHGLDEVLPARIARRWIHLGIGTIGVAYCLGVGPKSLPVVSIHLWEIAPFVAAAVVLSLVNLSIKESRRTQKLLELADKVETFTEDVKTRDPFLAPGGRAWRRVLYEYREYGKQAAVLLKGTSYASSIEYAINPEQLRSFTVIQVLLRAAAKTASEHRTKRWAKIILRDISVAVILFLVLWLISRTVAKWK